MRGCALNDMGGCGRGKPLSAHSIRTALQRASPGPEAYFARHISPNLSTLMWSKTKLVMIPFLTFCFIKGVVMLRLANPLFGKVTSTLVIIFENDNNKLWA